MGRILNQHPSELNFIHSIAEEELILAGEIATYYSVKMPKENKDPLYNEPIQHPDTGKETYTFDGPYELPCIMQELGHSVNVNIDGTDYERDAKIVFAKISFDRVEIANKPKYGDVIVYNDVYYELIDVHKRRHHERIDVYTHFDCDLKSREKYKVMRKLGLC